MTRTSHRRRSTSTWPTSSPASSRSRRSTCSCSTPTAASWPRTSSPRSTCRRSTTRSMDGYAVRVADVAGASDGVAGRSCRSSATSRPARRRPTPCSPGCAVRIMTGAPMPAGADAVVPGGVDRRRPRPAVRDQPGPRASGAHIRRRGEDVRRGQLVLEAGTRLGPGQLGLLAAVGRDRVMVRPRPRVVILSTGSELVEPGQPIAAGPDPRVELLHPHHGRARGRRHRLPGRHRARRPAHRCWTRSRTS